MGTKIQDTTSKTQDSQQKSWWNRPLFGDKSVIERITNWYKQKMFKGEVPESSVRLYTQSLRQLKSMIAIANKMENEKFSSREFSTFVQINSAVKSNAGQYESLGRSIDLLRVALETKDCFSKIEQTESRYHSYSQQEFYEYVFDLLEREVPKEQFKELVEKQLLGVISKVKTEEGKIALQSYMNQLNILSEDQLGLQLLYLFKQYDLSNLSLLRKVAEIADTFYDKNLSDFNEFSIAARFQDEVFMKLGEIIQIPPDKNVTDTYALILQYIALRNRHQNSFAQFEQFMSLLKKSLKFHDSIMATRKQYPPSDYKQPLIFQKEVPGGDLYKKYQEFIEN